MWEVRQECSSGGGSPLKGGGGSYRKGGTPGSKEKKGRPNRGLISKNNPGNDLPAACLRWAARPQTYPDNWEKKY